MYRHDQGYILIKNKNVTTERKKKASRKISCDYESKI